MKQWYIYIYRAKTTDYLTLFASKFTYQRYKSYIVFWSCDWLTIYQIWCIAIIINQFYIPLKLKSTRVARQPINPRIYIFNNYLCWEKSELSPKNIIDFIPTHYHTKHLVLSSGASWMRGRHPPWRNVRTLVKDVEVYLKTARPVLKTKPTSIHL